MIEVPIPSGCSYEDNQQAMAFETHREYFKDKVVIFCEQLPEGTHSFTIKLNPRYSGSYTLNPACIKLMYFPMINAHEGIKKVVIK